MTKMLVEQVEYEVTLNAEEILRHVGEFGRFQKLIDGIFCLIYFLVGLQILIMYFATITPTWKCISNSTICLFNGTRQAEDTHRCHISRDQWHYTEPTQYSLVTQFDIHCDEKWLLGLVSSMHFVGWGIGAIILGWIGDKYGRKLLLFPSTAGILAIGFVSIFMPNIYLIIVCRFFVGFFIPGAFVQANILISEMVGNKQRPMATLIPFISLAIGFSILGVKAYLLQNWKLLFITCTAPYVISLAFYPIIPESFIWLRAHGRMDDAMKVLRKIARWNNKVLAPNNVLSSPDLVTSNIVKINGRFIWQILVQCFIWITSSTSFFGLQLAAKELEGSVYRDFVILSMVQIPAVIIIIVLCDKIGRKKTSLISLLLAGVSCLGIAFIPANRNFIIARVIIGFIGKFFASISIQTLYIWSAEIFPAHMRSKGMGIVQVSSRIGATIAPWLVVELSTFGHSVPFVVLGVPPLVASVLGIWLPETNVDLSKRCKSNGITNENFNETNRMDVELVPTCE